MLPGGIDAVARHWPSALWVWTLTAPLSRFFFFFFFYFPFVFMDAPFARATGVLSQDSADLSAMSAAKQIELVPSRAPCPECLGAEAGPGMSGFRSLK